MKPKEWWIQENPQLKEVFGVGLTEDQKQMLRIYYTSGDVNSITPELEEQVQNITPEQYKAIIGQWDD